MLSKDNNIRWLQKRTEEYRSLKNDIGEVVEDFDEIGKLFQWFLSVDALDEVDIGDGETQRPTFITANLSAGQKSEMLGVLKECVDCFVWNYTEMPDLERGLVEHHLPIKLSFHPYKQPTRNFNPTVVSKVKEEVDRQLQTKFIRPCRYVDWISNVVPVEKKGTGKIRVCVDFWDLNRATPKDEYPMPIADILINNASGNKMISFLHGNVGYNRIFMAQEDVCKTVFRCLGFVGLFEWVVMTFGLKNVGATYQRAMNLIFHDMLGIMVEVYIDDIVIKSLGFEEHIANLQVALERMRKYGFVVHEQGIQIIRRRWTLYAK
jgi:hypothetical protein